MPEGTAPTERRRGRCSGPDSSLLERVLYASDPDRYEYRLTEPGRELFGAAALLMRWGDKYLAGPEGPPTVLRHHECGEIAEPTLTCGSCGKPITPYNVTPEPGPGFDSGSASS